MSAPVRDRALTLGAGPDQDQDAFLEDLQALDALHALNDEAEVVAYGLAQLSEGLDSVAPAPDARARLLAEVPAKGRFERFAEATAKMLDLGIEQAKALLDRLQDPDASVFSDELPGISFFWCEGGPAVANAVRGFVRVKAGTAFPNHEHIGDEIVLVLQGSFVDTSRGITFHVGDFDTMKAGTSHEYVVPEGGPDLLKLSVTQEGLRAMGLTYLPR